MNKFLARLGLFIFLIVLASVVLDYFISHRLKNSATHAYREYSVWNDIFSSKINADAIVLGSSRAWRHIDPQILQDSLGLSVYNLGMDGQHLPMELWRYSLFLKKNKKPDLIIFSLDFFMLDENKELFNKDQFLPYMLYHKEMESYLKNYTGFDQADFKLPLARYMGSYKAIFHVARITLFPEKMGKGRINGYYAENKKWNTDFEKAKASMKKYKARINPILVNQFDTFIKKCSRDNTKLILVYSPEYIEGQLFVENRKEVMASFQKLSQQNNIPFLDYSSDSISFQKALFYNATHLNKNGAELFSKKLAADLKLLSFN